jgi:SNF2 family DNA or RNA helicase
VDEPTTIDLLTVPAVETFALSLPVEAQPHPRFERPLQTTIREARLLNDAPWVRGLSKLALDVTTDGWRFPMPPETMPPRLDTPPKPRLAPPPPEPDPKTDKTVRVRPPRDAVQLKERLLYLLQPPLKNIFSGRQITVPCQPYPYQLEGIAFLMPRHHALLADEMGLGKTAQTILSLRLMFHTGMIRNALLVCPKPLVNNWSRELRTWAPDVPFEVLGGDLEERRAGWMVSNCPLKLLNYELLTRDAALIDDDRVRFDVVVLDEAQRIKNKESKTAQVVCTLRRERSWALTGTPIENKPDDLVNLFAFIDPGRIPPETPVKQLASLTADCILRRIKEDVMTDIPPKTIRDAVLELTPAQKEAYELAESEGVVRLNALGDTITVQHVFELVMRLKQICNFDPLTGQSAKLEQLTADLTEVTESGRKAIVFSQYIDPLEQIARALDSLGPLQFHGRIPPKERQLVLDRFKADRTKRVILMSYATGSVGLNLQHANYVFLFDRWWNPAVEDQAINRAHRIGQKDPVFVTRFISEGTIERKIADVLDRKRRLFNELIESNEAPAQLGMTEEEIFGLFDIQSRPRRAA